MELEFRPARPSDTDAAVPLIYSSGPAAFDYVFANPTAQSTQEFLKYVFPDGAGEHGYRIHTVVVHDGRVVGVGACYTGENSLSMMISAIRQIGAFYGLRYTPRVIRRGLKIEQLIQPPRGMMNYIGHLGVVPEYQGRGIGRRLIEHFLDIGRRAGRSKAALDVSVENPRAQALYERIGFQAVQECISTLPNVPDHRRMEMPL
ncbi:MAG: GNAT family N-acetyltransferase [Planctomycetaceae bacterium]|nr:GNAT family N-acetyltransferase [Planctomycetaceae bacterium]